MLWWSTTVVAPEMVAERRLLRLEQSGDALAIRGGSGDGGSPRSLYRNYLIEIASVPVDGGWSFTVDIFEPSGIAVTSIGAGKAVVFTTPRHASHVATTMAHVWIDARITS